jgi:lipopolysaccharide transport system ATP-binding protein
MARIGNKEEIRGNPSNPWPERKTMTDIAIRVENLSKQYKIGKAQQRHDTLRDALVDFLPRITRMARIRNKEEIRGNPSNPWPKENNPSHPWPEKDDTIWALRDVSFEVKRGEVVGIIGRNGAGKSTLLKILSRITEPTEGRAEIHGRVGSLLEVGTGFHPELTGRENIYLNGAILGMRKREIDKKFDEIVAFAEIEKFMETPVKRYSSGMYVRLAFAVAAHLDPEILLVDEVLAVGDAAFQKKCLGKMGDVAKEGRTVLFVSHNMAAVQALCTKALWLNRGEHMVFGDTNEVVRNYLQSIVSKNVVCLKKRIDRQGDGRLRFTDFLVYQSASDSTLVCGHPVSFEIYYESRPGRRLRNVHVSVGVNTLMDENVLYLSNDLVGIEFSDVPERGKFVCHIDRLPLAAGSYSVNLYCTVNGTLADWVIDAARISVEQGDYFGTGRLTPPSHSKVLIPHTWNLETQEIR